MQTGERPYENREAKLRQQYAEKSKKTKIGKNIAVKY